MVPPCSDRISRVPPYSRTWKTFTRTGPSPSLADRSKSFRFCLPGHWPGPRSLATTNGVSVDVLSSGYLDVSVRRVCLAKLYIHLAIPPKGGGFPHSEIPGSTCARNSPGLIATCYVLHRLSVPRHPPNALIALDRAKPSCAEINPNLMHRLAWRIGMISVPTYSRKDTSPPRAIPRCRPQTARTGRRPPRRCPNNPYSR